MRPRIMRAASRPTAKAEAANFVGDVLSDPVYAPEGPSRLRASRVTFMPGGRTNWHQHAVGQILYVLSGVGRYQLEGEPVQADERFFLVRVTEAAIDTSRHTELEQELMTQHRWFTLDELEDWPEAVFPLELADMIRSQNAT